MYFSNPPSGGTIMQSEVWRKRQREVPKRLRSKLRSGKTQPQVLHKRCSGKLCLHYPWGTLRTRKGVCQKLCYKINTENWTPSSSNVPMINTTSVRQRGCQSGFCWDTVDLLSPVLLSWSAPPLLLDYRDHLILITVSPLSALNHSSQINLKTTCLLAPKLPGTPLFRSEWGPMSL